MKDDLTILKERNAELYEELRKAQELRTETTVDGPAVRYAYRPATDTEKQRTPHPMYGGYVGERAIYWRLDELESALSHMRLSGAGDSNQVSMHGGALRMKLGDTGQTPEGWSFMRPVETSPKRIFPWIFLSSGITATITSLLIGLF